MALRISILGGRNLAPKSDESSTPYAEVFVLDSRGEAIGKARKTRSVKRSLNPSWNEHLEFVLPKDRQFSGMTVRVWDKHRLWPDKFMGQFTVKFNVERLLNGADSVDSWFPLSRRPGKTETVAGDLHVIVQCGNVRGSSPVVSSAAATASSTPLTAAIRREDPPAPRAANTAAAASSSSAAASDSTAAAASSPTLTVKSRDTDDTDKGHHPLKVSRHYERTAAVHATAVLVPEDEGEAAHNESEEDSLRARRGPSSSALVSLGKAVIAASKLEASHSNSSSETEYVVADVHVNSGRWYFETRIVGHVNQIQVGYATVTYQPPKRLDGTAWCWDVGRSRLTKKGEVIGGAYGEAIATSDVIGCALDVQRRKLSFFKNGRALGDAASDVSAGDGRIAPFFVLQRNAKIHVNFGKEPFTYPQEAEGFHPLHCTLTDAQLDKIEQLFQHYKDVGVKLSASGETGDVIKSHGTIQLYKDLNIAGDEDVSPLVLAWKLHAETVWVFTREEFVNGWTVYGCATLEAMKQRIAQWKRDVNTNNELFRSFYSFVFDYLRGDKKILLLDEAVMVWGLIFPSRKWKLFPDWIEFVKSRNVKSFTKDTWSQLVEFANTYPNDVKSYDETSSWPTVFDEFVSLMQKKDSSS